MEKIIKNIGQMGEELEIYKKVEKHLPSILLPI
jgi:hypothetical protein